MARAGASESRLRGVSGGTVVRFGLAGCVGASETVVEAGVTPASPREKRWGTLLSVVGALLHERVARAWGT